MLQRAANAASCMFSVFAAANSEVLEKLRERYNEENCLAAAEKKKKNIEKFLEPM